VRTAIAIIGLVVACGGGGKKADTSSGGEDIPPTTATATATATDDGVYGGAAYGGYKRTPQLAEFHDLIATKTTSAAACPASGELHDAAMRVLRHPPPGASVDLWHGESEELVAISEELHAHCSDGASMEADYDVAAMHRSFQRLLLQLGP
jgi:hypothetical protein